MHLKNLSRFSIYLRKVLFRTIIYTLIIAVLVVTADFILSINTSPTRIQVDTGYYENVMAFDRAIALTFDDGPDPQTTKQIIEILDRQQVPATFFILGSKAFKYPELVKLVAEKGYEIGNHSYSHAHDVHQSPERIHYELDVTNKILSNIIGKHTFLYRPPYLLDIGSDALPDPHGHTQVLDWITQAGYIPVGADIDSLDWQVKSSQEVIDNVMQNLDKGHIVLLHDGEMGKYTPEALEQLIIQLKEQDYRFVTVSDIIGLSKIDKLLVNSPLTLSDTDENTNGNVTRLQTFLMKEGYYTADFTGIFDSDTQAALIKWQNQHNLAGESGTVATKTLDQIRQNLEQCCNYVPTTVEQTNSNTQFGRTLLSTAIFASSKTQHQIPKILQLILILIGLRLIFISVWLIRGKLINPPKTNQQWTGGVSVIIPAFNEAENIGATLQSVLLNKRKKLEIIVVNDGSTDRTAEIVESFQEKYPKIIKFVSIPNSGKAAALNTGILAARYGVVVTMDGDSIFTASTLNELLKPFHDPSVAAVSGKVQVTETNNILNYFQHLEYVISQNIDKQAFHYINGISVIPGPVGAWRKETLRAVGGYSAQTMVEDQDITLAVLAEGKQVVYAPKAIAYTETPFNLNDFIKQRGRWILGTIQCLLKYKSHLFKAKSGSFGMLVLPNTLIYTVLLPILYPIVDLILISWLLFNVFDQFWPLFIAFIVIDLAYALSAFHSERKKLNVLLWLPLQRIYYRVLIFFVVIRSLVILIEGSEALWSKVMKRGEAQRYLAKLTNTLPSHS